MSSMTTIRAVHPDELATVVKVEGPSKGDRAMHRVRSEIGPSIVAIVASVVIMAGLMAFRLWWLMPASIHFQN
jgi:hypothetical protein